MQATNTRNTYAASLLFWVFEGSIIPCDNSRPYCFQTKYWWFFSLMGVMSYAGNEHQGYIKREFIGWARFLVTTPAGLLSGWVMMFWYPSWGWCPMQEQTSGASTIWSLFCWISIIRYIFSKSALEDEWCKELFKRTNKTQYLLLTVDDVL